MKTYLWVVVETDGESDAPTPEAIEDMIPELFTGEHIVNVTAEVASIDHQEEGAR